jgi:pimeloyl-ACP methyl ester carboxylesterase
MNTFDVAGRTLHYLTAGSGAPLVFVHGSGGSGRQWKHHYQHFSRTQRVMAYDLIGCGANQPLAIPSMADDMPEAEARLFSYEDDAAALLTAIEHVGGSADVVAHSAGGVGAILAALERPAAFRTLTLFEPVLLSLLRDAQDPTFDAIRDVALSYRLLYRSSGPGAAMGSFVDFWNGAGTWQQLPEPVRQSMVVGAGRLYLEWGIVLDRAPVLRATDLARLAQPVLYFCGAHTTEPMKQVTDIVLAHLRECRFVEVAGANHMAPFTHAAHVAPDIEAHLDGHDGRVRRNAVRSRVSDFV